MNDAEQKVVYDNAVDQRPTVVATIAVPTEKIQAAVDSTLATYQKAHAAKLASAQESLQAAHDMIADHLESGAAIPASALAGNAVKKSFLHHLRDAMKHVGDVAKDIGIAAAEGAGEILAGGAGRDE